MFHTYFFQKRLAVELANIIQDAEIIECFSQQKDELIISLVLNDQSEFHIKASLENEINLISFPAQFHRARKNSVDLFERIIGIKIESVEIINLDRSFIFSLSNGNQLVFKMHGNRSNILLIEGNSVTLFKNKLKADFDVSPEKLAKPVDSGKLDKESLPVLEKIAGKELKSYLKTNNYYSMEQTMKVNFWYELLQKLNNNPICVDATSKPTIDLLSGNCERSFSSPIKACNELYKMMVGSFFLNREKDRITLNLNQVIARSRNYIKKNHKKLQEIKNRRKYDEIANIIMANLHQIKPNVKKVTLTDFYSDKEIDIKLNPKLSPQKNAEQYYRKSKNERIEIEKLEQNISKKNAEIQELENQINLIRDSENYRELKKLLPDIKITSKNQENLPYRIIHKDGFEIRIGKNAAANDLLTLKYTNKNDYWLHARDVAGSHTVIKNDTKKPIPKPIIEYAAGLAAYFSKRKSDSLCPVIVTQKKYVRKSKGLSPGKVIVDKEEVILVKPLPPGE